jgi:hypothetical protein
MGRNTKYPKKQQKINEKLVNIGDKMVKKQYRDEWSKDNPTAGYCYILAEALYHYVYPNAKSYCLNLDEEGYEGLGTHWFLKDNGKIIDFAGEQYDFDIPYSKARRRAFLQGSVDTKRGNISKRGYELARLLGYVD